MKLNTSSFVEPLIHIIEKDGVNFPDQEPLQTYRKLLLLAPKLQHQARLLLYTLMEGTAREAMEYPGDVAYLDQYIKKVCELNGDTSYSMALGYAKVFSPENMAKWKK